MSWATNRATLKAAIVALGYQIIPENKEIEERPATANHKWFTMLMAGMEDVEMFTSNKIIYAHPVMVRVVYRGLDDTQLATNETLFITLNKTISALTDFKNYNTEPTLEKLDNKHLIGELDFQFVIDCNS